MYNNDQITRYGRNLQFWVYVKLFWVRTCHNCWHSVQREQPITSHAHASCNSVNWPLRDARPRRTTPAVVDCLQSWSNCYVRRILWHTDSLAAAMTDNRDNDSIDWHGRITLRTRIANSLTRCHSATCCLHVSSDQSPHNHPMHTHRI